MLALDLIRSAAEHDHIAVGPVLVMAYKNHALDEFILDAVDKYPANKQWPGFLIRTGQRSDDPSLHHFGERNSRAEQAAQQELTRRQEVQRQTRRVGRDWLDCARSLETLMGPSAPSGGDSLTGGKVAFFPL